MVEKGPDENGLYDSYALVLREAGGGRNVGEGGASSTDPDAQMWHSNEQNSLSPLFAYAVPNDDMEYIVNMRMFNFGNTRRRALTSVTKVNSYSKNRRTRVMITESKNIAWQTVIAIVFGLFSLTLSLLIGQFWEPAETERVGGPGTRRRVPPPRRRQAGVSTSKVRGANPSGYGSYGGYKPQKTRF